jgi:hypothetical protein
MSVHDPHVWSKYGRSGAEAGAAQTHKGVPNVCVLPAVANFDTRSARGDVASPKDVIARECRKFCPGPDAARHPSEGSWVEVDCVVLVLAALEQFQLEGVAPAD